MLCWGKGVISMPEIYCSNSNIRLVLSNVCIQRVRTGEWEQILEGLYAGREPVEITYSGLYYSQFDESSADILVSMAERLPVSALQEPQHAMAFARLLREELSDPHAYLKQAEKEGLHLYLHYAGETQEYAVIARDVSIRN